MKPQIIYERVITMKKILSVLLSILIIAAVTLTAYAENVDTIGSSSGADVKAKYHQSVPDDVYSIDVTWGAMEFDYIAAGEKWDDEAHKWVADESKPAEWQASNSGSNIVTLANHSSKAIDASFVFEANTDYSDISGSFVYNGAPLTSALSLKLPEADKPAENYAVTFNPSGQLPATHSDSEYSKMGTITVTLS